MPLLPDGFPGQRLRVLPPPLVRSTMRRAPTSGLLVTDAGYFPHAANHGRQRAHGTAGAVVIVCTTGAGWCRVGGRVTRVVASHALVLPPGLPHVYWADQHDPWTIWWLHAAGSHLPDFLEVICPADRESLIDLGDSYRAAATIEDAVGHLEHDETVPSLIAGAGCGWSLLAQLAADVAAGPRERIEPVRQAMELLRHDFVRPVSVPELARTAGLSTSHFSALFHAATGGGVIEYAKRLRMARARELLITSSRSIAEIAEHVGYRDPFYFSRQFRAVHGCGPQAYREQDTPPIRHGRGLLERPLESKRGLASET